MELGVVPRDARFIYTTTAFVLHDQRTADVETISAGLTVTDLDELNYYEQAWSGLHHQAEFGDAARRRIATALTHYGARG